jgi:hypothetical protein
MDRDVVAVNIVIITPEITDRAGRRASVGSVVVPAVPRSPVNSRGTSIRRLLIAV